MGDGGDGNNWGQLQGSLQVPSSASGIFPVTVLRLEHRCIRIPLGGLGERGCSHSVGLEQEPLARGR